MVNPEIITALKNAIDHGESLEEAKQVLMNSGYNLAEIQEASSFIGGGAVSSQQAKPQEELAMPRKKGILGKFARTKRPQPAIVRMPNPPKQMPTPRALPPQPTQPQPSTPQIQQPSINQIQRLIQQAPQTTPQQQAPQQQAPQTTPQQQTQPQVQAQPPIQRTSPQTNPTGTPQSEIKPFEFPNPSGGELTKEIRKIKPAGPGHAKEIILFVILLMLIIILVLSFVFKDKIVNLFSFFLGLL